MTGNDATDPRPVVVGLRSGLPAGATCPAVDAVVVTAMDAEHVPFAQRADALSPEETLGHAQARLATFGARKLLLVTSGIGAVNAAVATTLALQIVRTPVVIAAGSAGGLGRDVRVGDVVVGSTYSYGAADATAFGYALGQVPGMPEVYLGAEAFVAGAHARAGVLVGQMLSADSFVDARSVESVREAFPEALTTDMETTAIAQASHILGVPFVSVRGVSDLCGPQAGEDHRLALDAVAALAADVALDLVGDDTLTGLRAEFSA